MRTGWRISILMLGIVIAGCTSPDNRGWKYQLNLNPGRSFRLITSVDQSTTQAQGEMEQVITQAIVTEYLMTVRDVSSQNDVLADLTYNRIQFRKTQPDGTVEYDSAGFVGTVPQDARIFALLIGRKFSITVNQSGIITAVSGINEMHHEIVNAMDGLDESSRESVLNGLRDNLGEETIRESIDGFWTACPDHPIPIGNSWQSNEIVSQGIPVSILNTWQLKELDSGRATVELKSVIRTSKENAAVSFGMATMTYDVSGEQSGTAVFNLVTGMLISSDILQKFSGTLNMVGNRENLPSMSWPITVESRIQHSVVEN